MTAANTHHVPGLSFTDETLAARRASLGASEIAAVAGLNSRKSPLDVYLEKTGAVAPFAGNEFTEWGLRLEQPIAQKYAEVTGVLLRLSDPVVAGWMSCTPDRIVERTDEPDHGLEIKRFGEYREDEFGTPGTDQVPDDVAIQCHWSMMVTGLDRWDLAVLLGQADFRIYTLRADPAVHRSLYDIGRTFWLDHVEKRVPPAIDGSASARKYLARTFTTHTNDLLDPTEAQRQDARQLADLRDEKKHLDTEIDLIENRIKQAIGDHAGIRGIATWKRDKTGRVSWKEVASALGATKPEHQQLLAAHTGEPSRRFRFTFEEA